MKPQFPIFFILIISSVLMFSQESRILDFVRNNDLDSVKIYLERNKDLVHVKDEYGRTPLHWAARGVYPELMRELISSGADVNAMDINKVTPIISVVARNHVDGLQLLIEHGARTLDKDIEGDYLIHLAASYGYPEMIRILLEQEDVLELRNSRERTPLILACRESGDIETVKYLIDMGANLDAVDKYGGSPLSLAAWRGYNSIVNLLLEEGAHIEVQGEMGMKLLQYACEKDLHLLYLAIIENGGDLKTLQNEDQSALHWAAMGGSVDIVKDLLSRDMDVNTTDLYGWSPIHYAAYFGRTEVLTALLNQDANPDLKTPLNETACNLAENRSNTDISAILALHGANVNEELKTGITGEYFGQKQPGYTPELFAPGIASRLKGGHSNITFSTDADMAFWTEWNLTESGYSDGSKIIYSYMQNGEWVYPEILYQNADCPVFSPDGKRLYFLANLKLEDGREDYGIWYHELDANLLSEPIRLDFDVSRYGLYWQFSFDNEGNIYFGGSHGMSMARYSDGKFGPPQLLSDIMHPDYMGGSPYISPDGDFLIFNSGDLEDCFGGSDLYVGFKLEDGSWTAPINLGAEINTSQSESLARLSLDGNFFFYKTNFGSIKWVDAALIERLRPE